MFSAHRRSITIADKWVFPGILFIFHTNISTEIKLYKCGSQEHLPLMEQNVWPEALNVRAHTASAIMNNIKSIHLRKFSAKNIIYKARRFLVFLHHRRDFFLSFLKDRCENGSTWERFLFITFSLVQYETSIETG